MTDEELDAQIGAEQGEEVIEEPVSTPTEEEPNVEPETTPAKEEETDPEEEPKADPKEDPQDPPEDKPEPAPSRRESLRIQQLVQKMKQTSQPQTPTPTYKGIDYSQELEADPETIQRLEDDRKQYGSTATNEAREISNSNLFMTRLEIDAPKVESKFPQLNKESDDFKPHVANAINEWYLQTTGFDAETGRVGNPNIRYSEFVESVMELVEAATESKAKETTKNIAKQAAQTSLRPDGSQAKRLNLNQAPENMSDEELDAMIVQAAPSR